MDHVFLRGMHHQKVDGRSPPTAPTSIAAASGWTAGISRRERGRFVCTIRDTLQCWHTRRGWAAGRYQFPNRDRYKRHHSQVRKSPWTMFFYGAYTTKKLTAAPLQRPR